MKSKSVNKTQRILSVYHLLKFCKEVSMQEMTSRIQANPATFRRDIAVLKAAGIQVSYSKSLRVFVLTSRERLEPAVPEGKIARLYLAQIVRLTTMMDEMGCKDDPDKWYLSTFSQSKRTMQRDFATLNSIGYGITYEREMFNSHDQGHDLPINHYYCDFPHSTDELLTF